MNKTKIYTTIGIVVILVIVVSATIRNKRTDNIKIGVIIPLSENVAPIGEKIKRGIELAKDTNPDNNIEFVFEDGAIEPRKALTSYQKLTSFDKTKIFIGPFGPDQIMSIAPIMNPDEIMLGITLCDDRFQQYPQVFCTYPSIPDQTKSGLDIIKEKNLRKIGFITQVGEIGDVIEKELLENQKNYNYSLEMTDRIKLGDRDFRTAIAKIKAKEVDAVYFATLPDEGYLIIKQLRELGYPGTILAVFDAVEEKLNELSTVSEGIYLPGHISPKFENKFVSKYKEKYSEEPDMYVALGHSIAVMLIKALQNNDYESIGLENKLINSENDTAINKFKFKPDRTVSIPVMSLIFKDGKIQMIN